MTSIPDLTELNAQRWRSAKCTREFSAVAKKLMAGKPRYASVQSRTRVPWFVIAVIHEREASGKWDTQLGQGDPLNEVSRHEPKDRGPFTTWEDGAYDALVNCPPYAWRWKDWSTGGTLTLLEEYNGLGPEIYHHVPSGYIWAGTSVQQRGKYVADGKWDGSVWDEQLGCAGLLMAMRALDPTIRFADESMPPPDVHPIEPPVQQTARPGGFFAIVNLILSMFKRK